MKITCFFAFEKITQRGYREMGINYELQIYLDLLENNHMSG